jgi:hypothetical protein
MAGEKVPVPASKPVPGRNAPDGVSQFLSYSKVALSLSLRNARPQAPNQVRRAVQVHVHESLLAHHSAPELPGLPGFGARESRMRSGRCSSSSASPTVSWRGSATSASRSAIPRVNSTVA